MADEATKLFASIGADIRDYEQKMAQADQIAKRTAASMQNELDQAMTAMNGSTSRAGRISEQFSRHFGTQAPAALETLRTASQGTVADTELMSQALADAGEKSLSLNDALGVLTGGLGGVASAMGVGAIVTFIGQIGGAVVDLSKLGAGASRIGNAFTNNFSDAEGALQKLREASLGSISDTDLMLSANRAMMLQVSSDADELARLLVVAAERGRALGISTAEAFDNLMVGIGRRQPLILDNLAIITGGEKVYEDYAASIGKARDALTEVEERAALINLVLGGSGGQTQLVADAATEWERLTTAVENFKTEVGKSWIGQAASWVAGQLATGINTVSASSSESSRMQDNEFLTFIESFQGEMHGAVDAGQLTIDQIRNDLGPQ